MPGRPGAAPTTEAHVGTIHVLTQCYLGVSNIMQALSLAKEVVDAWKASGGTNHKMTPRLRTFHPVMLLYSLQGKVRQQQQLEHWFHWMHLRTPRLWHAIENIG